MWQIYLNCHQKMGILNLKKRVNRDKCSFTTKQRMFRVFAIDEILRYRWTRFVGSRTLCHPVVAYGLAVTLETVQLSPPEKRFPLLFLLQIYSFQCEHGYLNCGKGRSKGGKGGGYGGGKGNKGGGYGFVDFLLKYYFVHAIHSVEIETLSNPSPKSTLDKSSRQHKLSAYYTWNCGIRISKPLPPI